MVHTDRSGTQSERGGLPGQLLSGPGHGGWEWPFLTGGHTQSRTRALWPVRKGPRDTVLSLVPWRSRFSNSLGRERPSERISGFKIPRKYYHLFFSHSVLKESYFLLLSLVAKRGTRKGGSVVFLRDDRGATAHIPVGSRGTSHFSFLLSDPKPAL